VKILEIITICFALISGGCLASIQIRRIVKGELPMFGLGIFTAAAKINLDKFDKRMLLISGFCFVIFIVLAVTNFT